MRQFLLGLCMSCLFVIQVFIWLFSPLSHCQDMNIWLEGFWRGKASGTDGWGALKESCWFSPSQESRCMHPESHESWTYHVETGNLLSPVCRRLWGLQCFPSALRLAQAAHSFWWWCCAVSPALCWHFHWDQLRSWWAAPCAVPFYQELSFFSWWCSVEVAAPRQVLLVTDLMAELLNAKILSENCEYWHTAAEEGIQLFTATCIPWVCSTGIKLLLLKE